MKQLLKSRGSLHYPYSHEDVDAFYASSQASDRSMNLKLFTYGSLLNRESALRTLSEITYDAREACVTFGFKRVFNRDVDVSGIEHYATPSDPRERGMLNVVPTGDAVDTVNGFCFAPSPEEFARLCEREHGYDIVPCVICPWDTFEGGSRDLAQMWDSLEIAYTFSANNKPETTDIHVRDDILPVREYFEIVKNGVSTHGDEFLQFWYETTHLAGQGTTLSQWEVSHQTIPKIK